jgi:hypothetical protein
MEEMAPSHFLLRTHYNSANKFDKCKLIDSDYLLVKEKRLYSFIISCGVNDMCVGLVDQLTDREDGDLEFVVRSMRKKMPLDDEIIKFNLEMILKG